MKAFLQRITQARRLRAIADIERSVLARARALSDDDLRRDTLVVAPHPDDETLGCGGTIARIRALGAAVAVVVCTDGSRSHPHRMTAAELRRLRGEEVLRACATLGVASADVHQLGIEDSKLVDHETIATNAIADLLQAGPFARILLPFREDGVSDHEAAFRAGRSAVSLLGASCEVWEYPVWLWNRWPFSMDRGYGVRGRFHALLRHRASAGALQRIDAMVAIASTLPRKTAALAEHATQMQRRDGHPDWRVLSDVADGAWLRRLLGENEYFATRR